MTASYFHAHALSSCPRCHCALTFASRHECPVVRPWTSAPEPESPSEARERVRRSLCASVDFPLMNDRTLNALRSILAADAFGMTS